MKTSKRLISLLLAMLMLVSCIMGTLVSCGDKNKGDGDKDGDNGDIDSSVSNYTIRVKTIGGRALSGITAYVYTDSTLDDIVDFGKTNDEGIAIVDTAPKSGYVVVLDGVPAGYDVKEYYELKSASVDIVLSSSVILPETEGAYTIPPKYSLGDIMYDFKVTDTEGKAIVLSEVLKEKKAVLINFWYSTCDPCINEFPFINTAAKEYEDNVAVICLNTYAPDNEAAVKTFKNSMNLDLTMAKADPALFAAFGDISTQVAGQTGYPTNVMIDRYGTICLVEVGGLPSEKPFRKMFDYFGAADAEYEQKIFKNLSELIPREIPDIQQEDSAVLEGVLNSDSVKNEDGTSKITYYPERGTADAEYSWPFIVTKKGDIDCLKASNVDKDDSYAIMHADVVMKAGDVLGFDYFSSTEEGADILHILVDNEAIYQISGIGDNWKHCYPYVAKEDGTYTVSFVYQKDSDTYKGDDAVYLKNFRIVAKSSIDVETYIPYQAARVDESTGDYTYENVKYCSQDGYYHVCSINDTDHICVGKCPILLANLMNINPLSEDESVYLWAYNGEVVLGGVDYAERIIQYCSYASNGTISGFCSVNEELKELLCKVIEIKGFDKTENEWLKFCKYYDAYGTKDGKALEDPIAGVAPHSAFDTFLSFDSQAELDVSNYPEELKVLSSEKDYPNNVYYDGRIIMPRGFWYAFTPAESGVYRITSDSKDSLNAWIFTYDYETHTQSIVNEYDLIERITKIPYSAEDAKYQMNNVSMVMYMEAGKTYYIDIAYYDVTMFGEFTFKVEYVGESLDLFRSASPGGAFTTDLDENGEMGNTLIAGGIDVALDPSTGYYRHVLSKDKNGNIIFGEYVYLDLTLAAGPFDKPIYIDPTLIKDGAMRKDLLSLGAFDFSRTADDINGLLYLKLYTLLGLREYAKSGSDATFRAEVANKIAAWELEAIKKYISESSDDEIFTLVYTNYSNNTSRINDTQLGVLVKAYSDAVAAEQDASDEKAAIVAYGKTLSDATLKAFIALKDITVKDDEDPIVYDRIASTYVNDYTDALLLSTYLKPLNVSNDVKNYLNNYVTNSLKELWGADYQLWYDSYKMDDLKKGIMHGKGEDHSDDILVYVNKMFNSETDLSALPEEVRAELTSEAYGCVLVDANLAKILQTLMDQNTFAGVINSWTKMCYYYEMHDANTKY
ncbi:MAG: TlpA family protein disulfide reductase [Clostridia bacterium]|nr:TlpA family protein disulfide reductase [Clostridia bacterium]